VPATSNADDGLSRRPRDARLIHLILSAQGIHSYQERVPLQLLDFAYRYTQSVLSDALRLAAEGYTATTGTNSKRDTGTDSAITVNSLRQAIASRQDYQFHSALPKDFMLEQAAEKNRTMLPKIEKSWGVQLPPEKYCLVGSGWTMKESWDSDDDDAAEGDQQEDGHSGANGVNGTARRSSMFGAGKEGSDEKEEGDEMDSFEDVFGGNAGEDQEMTEG
jgi:transcription initiation factor TFIID subunit 9B